jgi:hypothetical protein
MKLAVKRHADVMTKSTREKGERKYKHTIKLKKQLYN